jgi:hypothetical protein
MHLMKEVAQLEKKKKESRFGQKRPILDRFHDVEARLC